MVLESMETDTIPDQEKARKIICKKPNNVYQTSRGKYCEVIQPVNRYQRAFLCRVYHSSEYSFTYPCNSGIIGHAQFAKQRYTIRRIEADELMTRCMKFPLTMPTKLLLSLCSTTTNYRIISSSWYHCPCKSYTSGLCFI